MYALSELSRFAQDRKPLVEVTEIPVDLLKKKDSKDAEYPMDNDEAKAEFLKASWASCGKVLNLLCLAGAAISNNKSGSEASNNAAV